jgi:hypothetical protein
MLSDLFLHNKDSKAKEIESVLVEAVQNSHPSDFLDALQPFADSNDENVSKTAIDLKTRILIRTEDGEVKKCVAPISETLTTTAKSSSSEVRKATVLFFVAVITQPEAEVDQCFIFQTLSKIKCLDSSFSFDFDFIQSSTSQWGSAHWINRC